jgi:hypothetical protein
MGRLLDLARLHDRGPGFESTCSLGSGVPSIAPSTSSDLQRVA